MVMFLQFYGTIANVLQQWEDMGIFYYALPFLLLFAIVFAIISKTKLVGEGEKGIATVIALAVALLSLQFDYVPQFFAVILPRAGIGIAVLLVALILMGLFMPLDRQGPLRVFMWIGGVIAIIVILSSFSSYEWWYSSFWANNMSAIIAGIIVIVFISIVVGSSGKPPTTENTFLKFLPKE